MCIKFGKTSHVRNTHTHLGEVMNVFHRGDDLGAFKPALFVSSDVRIILLRLDPSVVANVFKRLRWQTTVCVREREREVQ